MIRVFGYLLREVDTTSLSPGLLSIKMTPPSPPQAPASPAAAGHAAVSPTQRLSGATRPSGRFSSGSHSGSVAKTGTYGTAAFKSTERFIASRASGASRGGSPARHSAGGDTSSSAANDASATAAAAARPDPIPGMAEVILKSLQGDFGRSSTERFPPRKSAGTHDALDASYEPVTFVDQLARNRTSGTAPFKTAVERFPAPREYSASPRRSADGSRDAADASGENAAAAAAEAACPLPGTIDAVLRSNKGVAVMRGPKRFQSPKPSPSTLVAPVMLPGMAAEIAQKKVGGRLKTTTPRFHDPAGRSITTKIDVAHPPGTFELLQRKEKKNAGTAWSRSQTPRFVNPPRSTVPTPEPEAAAASSNPTSARTRAQQRPSAAFSDTAPRFREQPLVDTPLYVAPTFVDLILRK